MDPEIMVGVASVVVIPLGATIYKFVQKVNRHEALLPEMKDGIDRVESKLDNLTSVVFEAAFRSRANKGRGEEE